MSLIPTQRLRGLEPWLFGALVLLHAVPVLAFAWFPTLDGPAHLYNARIISSLLGGDAATGSFFELNPFPEPNWLGHAIMAGVMSISSPQAAERVVMLLYVVGLPLAFRFALRRMNGQNAWASLLAFPFIYCFTFRIGFLNFSLGLPLLLLTLGVGAKLTGTARGRDVLGLGFLLTLLYFAHLTCFLLGVGLLFGLLWWAPLADSASSSVPTNRHRLARIKPLLLAACPGILLSIAFFLSHSDQRIELKRLTMADLLFGLLNGRPFVALSDADLPYARIIAFALLLMTCVVVVSGLRGRTLHRSANGWLIIAMAGLLGAYFLVPDQMATGGFISVRLLLFTYLLWALWLGLCPIPRWWNTAALGLMLVADLLLLRMHYEHTEALNIELAEVLSVAPAVPEHAVLVPLNYSGNWMHSNFPCYLGTICEAEVLDNFGARTPHMPVRWKGGKDPSTPVGNFNTSDRPCVALDVRSDTGDYLVDHILTYRLGAALNDSCTMDVRAQLEATFVEVAVSPLGDARLYKRKQGAGR